MMRHLFHFFIAAILISLSSNAMASWNYYENYAEYRINNEARVTLLNIDHHPQPNNYTCGATNVTSLFEWETKVKGNTIQYNINSLYNYINTNGVEGIQTDELKEGIEDIKSYTNSNYNMGLDFGLTEISSDTINNAMWLLYDWNIKKLNPVILYGNTKNGLAGYHYYMVTGAVNCETSTCGFYLKGVFLNDSVYNSPGWPANHDRRINAIAPDDFITDDELETYWKKCGAKLPWNKKHIMLTFPRP